MWGLGEVGGRADVGGGLGETSGDTDTGGRSNPESSICSVNVESQIIRGKWGPGFAGVNSSILGDVAGMGTFYVITHKYRIAVIGKAGEWNVEGKHVLRP